MSNLKGQNGYIPSTLIIKSIMIENSLYTSLARAMISKCGTCKLVNFKIINNV